MVARLLEAIRLAGRLCSSEVLLLLGARSLWRLAALPAVSYVLCRIPAVVHEAYGKGLGYQHHVVCHVHGIRVQKVLSWVGGI